MALLPCRDRNSVDGYEARTCIQHGMRLTGKRSRWGRLLPIGFVMAAALSSSVMGQSQDNGPSATSDLEYDANYAQNEKIFNQLMWNTTSCMHEAAKSALMLGDRNRESIVKFASTTCSAALSMFMIDTMAQPKPRVGFFIQALAYQELNRIPGVRALTTSAEKPSATPPPSTRSGSTRNNSASCYSYGDGNAVVLKGKVSIEMFYGPPNYGETPETDAKEYQAVLTLDKPICVNADPESEEPEEKGQKLVTLVPISTQNLSRYEGKLISVSGTLFHAQTGHHHTPLLLSLSSPAKILD